MRQGAAFAGLPIPDAAPIMGGESSSETSEAYQQRWDGLLKLLKDLKRITLADDAGTGALSAVLVYANKALQSIHTVEDRLQSHSYSIAFIGEAGAGVPPFRWPLS